MSSDGASGSSEPSEANSLLDEASATATPFESQNGEPIESVLERLRQAEILLAMERRRNADLELQLQLQHQLQQQQQQQQQQRQANSGSTTPVAAAALREGVSFLSGVLSPPSVPLQAAPAPWRKVLYVRQRYRDNYVPPSFLSQLVANAHLRRPDLRQYLANTTAVTQQISAVSLLLVVFMFAKDGTFTVPAMVAGDLLLLFGGYATLASLEKYAAKDDTFLTERDAAPSASRHSEDESLLFGVSQSGAASSLDRRRPVLDAKGWRAQPLMAEQVPNGSASTPVAGDDVPALAEAAGGQGHFTSGESTRARTLGSFALFLATLRTMAPVLRTLTVSYSDDTIDALAITLSVLHVAFHDYSYANCVSTHFRGTLSLNAAMFATVLLASRLESNESVFALVLFAVELFAFFPLARHRIRRRSLAAHLVITGLLVASTSALLLLRDATLFTVFVGTVAFVSFACPLGLVSIQRHKYHVEGPWDIAEVADLE